MLVEPELPQSLAALAMNRFALVLSEPVPRSVMTISMEQPPSQRQLPVMVEPELPTLVAVLVLCQQLDLVLPVPPLAGLSLRRPPHP